MENYRISEETKIKLTHIENYRISEETKIKLTHIEKYRISEETKIKLTHIENYRISEETKIKFDRFLSSLLDETSWRMENNKFTKKILISVTLFMKCLVVVLIRFS